MEKNRYIKPEVNICELDTKAQILSVSGDLIQSNDPAMPDAEVYSNADMFPDIWDTKF